MHLTSLQRRTLEIYGWYRRHPPTWPFLLSGLIWRSWYLLFPLLIGLAVLLILSGRNHTLDGWLLFLGGLALGMLARTLLAYRQTIRLWPLLQAIIDWQAVEDLLERESP